LATGSVEYTAVEVERLGLVRGKSLTCRKGNKSKVYDCSHSLVNEPGTGNS